MKEGRDELYKRFIIFFLMFNHNCAMDLKKEQGHIYIHMIYIHLHIYDIRMYIPDPSLVRRGGGGGRRIEEEDDEEEIPPPRVRLPKLSLFLSIGSLEAPECEPESDESESEPESLESEPEPESEYIESNPEFSVETERRTLFRLKPRPWAMVERSRADVVDWSGCRGWEEGNSWRRSKI